MRLIYCVLAVLLFSFCSSAEEKLHLDPAIKTLVPGVTLTLVAEHPDVMTPTGIDVDDAGNIWFVCSHTHFRPDDYDGPQHDEIVVLRNGKRTVFYDKTDATMDLELAEDFKPGDWVYLAQRDRILRVRDTDGDGVGDLQENVAVLETEGTYPHNGLSGMAWQTNGDLVFALGENHWEKWELSSRDGSTAKGSGEGGVFRCKPDGSQLRRIAKGFWNPFGICVRKDSTMFVCENDPGSRPPCRLLHVVQGGDYGYQRLYGNAPHHPFVCWDGELPGTLPMLFSVGEAPCGIAPFNNGLLVTSWTDHRIDFYPLKRERSSFETDRISLISGSLDFRPTCITQQSPTTFYLTDWVVGSYQLHKKGRVWKLEIDPAADVRFGNAALETTNNDAKQADRLRTGGKGMTTKEIHSLASSSDPFLARAAIDALSNRIDEYNESICDDLSAVDQISLLLAIRKADPASESWVKYFLQNDDTQVVCETLRWIADENLRVFMPQVDEVLQRENIDYLLFESALAASNTLAGEPRKGVVDQDVLLSHVLNEKSNAKVRAFALRLIKPDSKRLHKEILNLASTKDRALLRAIVRWTAASEIKGTQDVLRQMLPLAKDDSQMAADIVAGLTPIAEQIDGLIGELADKPHPVREEFLRLLRTTKLTAKQKEKLASLTDTIPDSADLIDAAIDPSSVSKGRPDVEHTAAWKKRLAAIGQKVDIDAGRRIFHHRSIGACSKCHRHDGRGNTVGPDLSAASFRGNVDRLLVAVLQPSRDVDPQYFPRTLILDDGKVFTGIMLRDGGGGKEFYRDSAGQERSFKTAEISDRKELRISMMPSGLVDSITDREIRDLLAFLDQSTD